MNINEVLTLIAAQLHCDPKELIAYSDEDTELGGFHIRESERKFPMGSAWEVELRIIYALIRWLKPDTVAEMGGWRGASASHMALAVKANGFGKIYSVDNGSEGGIHGENIPPQLRQYITLVREDARVWLAAQSSQSIGFLFEDASHDTGLVTEITRLALAKCEPGGLYVNHDAMHDYAFDGDMNKYPSPVGAAVREGLARGGAYSSTYLAEPSDCGLAITVVPGVRVSKPVDVGYHSNTSAVAADHLAALSQVGNANIESASEPPPVVPMSQRLSVPKDTAEDIHRAAERSERMIADADEDTKETPVKKTRKPRTPKAK